MAEGSYEFEVMRAELLGIEPPSRAVFEEAERERMAAQQEEIGVELTKEVDLHEEKLQGGSGKLDDLNQILHKTQIKLNKFKGVCGSLTNLLRIKSDSKNNSTETLNHPPGTSKADPNLTDDENDEALKEIEAEKVIEAGKAIEANKKQLTAAGQELDSKLSSNLDKLDILIHKAERAEMSMEKQNKQMKGLLR